MDKVGVAILACLGIVAVMIVLALFGAFTISTLWGWFVVPLGVKSVTMAHAYGLSTVVTVFMSMRGLQGNDSGQVLVGGIMLNIFALIFGGIALQFM